MGDDLVQWLQSETEKKKPVQPPVPPSATNISPNPVIMQQGQGGTGKTVYTTSPMGQTGMIHVSTGAQGNPMVRHYPIASGPQGSTPSSSASPVPVSVSVSSSSSQIPGGASGMPGQNVPKGTPVLLNIVPVPQPGANSVTSPPPHPQQGPQKPKGPLSQGQSVPVSQKYGYQPIQQQGAGGPQGSGSPSPSPGQGQPIRTSGGVPKGSPYPQGRPMNEADYIKNYLSIAQIIDEHPSNQRSAETRALKEKYLVQLGDYHKYNEELRKLLDPKTLNTILEKLKAAQTSQANQTNLQQDSNKRPYDHTRSNEDEPAPKRQKLDTQPLSVAQLNAAIAPDTPEKVQQIAQSNFQARLETLANARGLKTSPDVQKYLSQATDMFLLSVMESLVSVSKRRTNKLREKMPVTILSNVKEELEIIEQREKSEQIRRESEENEKMFKDSKKKNDERQSAAYKAKIRKEEVRNINSVAFEAVGDITKRSTSSLKASSGINISSPNPKRDLGDSQDYSSGYSTPIGSPSPNTPSATSSSSSLTPTKPDALGSSSSSSSLSSSLSSSSGTVPLKNESRASITPSTFQRRITFNDLLMYVKFEMSVSQCNASFLYKILHGKDIIMR